MSNCSQNENEKLRCVTSEQCLVRDKPQPCYDSLFGRRLIGFDYRPGLEVRNLDWVASRLADVGDGDGLDGAPRVIRMWADRRHRRAWRF